MRPNPNLHVPDDRPRHVRIRSYLTGATCTRGDLIQAITKTAQANASRGRASLTIHAVIHRLHDLGVIKYMWADFYEVRHDVWDAVEAAERLGGTPVPV